MAPPRNKNINERRIRRRRKRSTAAAPAPISPVDTIMGTASPISPVDTTMGSASTLNMSIDDELGMKTTMKRRRSSAVDGRFLDTRSRSIAVGASNLNVKRARPSSVRRGSMIGPGSAYHPIHTLGRITSNPLPSMGTGGSGVAQESAPDPLKQVMTQAIISEARNENEGPEIQDQTDLNRKLPKNSLSSGNTTGQRLAKARKRYIAEQAKVIHGQESVMFPKQIPYSNQLGLIKSTMGSGLATVYGVSNQPDINPRQALNSDIVAASRYFAHPETDILAYHRRIEAPEVYTKTPVFGF